jgi:hypothetical protein
MVVFPSTSTGSVTHHSSLPLHHRHLVPSSSTPSKTQFMTQIPHPTKKMLVQYWINLLFWRLFKEDIKKLLSFFFVHLRLGTSQKKNVYMSVLFLYAFVLGLMSKILFEYISIDSPLQSKQAHEFNKFFIRPLSGYSCGLVFNTTTTISSLVYSALPRWRKKIEVLIHKPFIN